MMRRCVLELSRRRLLPTQRPDFILSRNGFSSSSRHSVPPKSSGSAGNTPPPPPSPPVDKLPEPGNSKKGLLVVGGVLISGAIAAAAYQNLYLNKPVTKEESSSFDISEKIPKDIHGLKDEVVVSNPEPSSQNENAAHIEEVGKNHSDSPQSSDFSKVVEENKVESGLGVTPQEDVVHVQQNDLPSFSQDGIPSDDQTTHSEASPEEPIDKKEVGNGFTNAQNSTGQNEVVDATLISQETDAISKETEIRAPSAHHLTSQNAPEASLSNGAEPPSSLTDLYYLGDKNEKSDVISLDEKGNGYVSHSKDKEDLVGTSEELKDGYISKSGNLVLDFLEAIHAAEKRQAEIDAHILAEEKRNLKEKYENELKDAKARELVFAETAAMLDKELDQERAKTAATVKTIQQKAEENLKMELERKDSEAEMQLKKVKELAQAELAAAIVSEKASQIEKMAEANLHIDALCMAFYARSEEARQTHSVHKLALGALALEDALSKGLPIQSEISALHTYLEGIDKDSLLNLALSSLPEETLNHGTETQMQLNQKFDALKPTLRHYSLIPPGGGGLLTHAVARVASGIKVKENEPSGDGIESTISRVESFLAEGKLVDAADALEGGVTGTQAEEFIGEWVNRAKNRAITEQALSLLQSYATSISVT